MDGAEQDGLALGPGVRVAGVDAGGTDDVLGVFHDNVIALDSRDSQCFHAFVRPARGEFDLGIQAPGRQYAGAEAIWREIPAAADAITCPS